MNSIRAAKEEAPKAFARRAVKITLESVSRFFLCPSACPDTDIEQKLTVNQNGRVTFTSKIAVFRTVPRDVESNSGPEDIPFRFEKSCSAGRWMKATLRKEAALELLEAMIEPFRTQEALFRTAEARITDCGFWKLTAYNEENEKFVFGGSLFCDCFPGAEELSYHIRRTLGMDSLYAFDGGSGFEKYTYVSVVFSGNKKAYYYIAGDESISVGDRVLVPFGKEEREGEAAKVKAYSEQNVPVPLEKTKTIIKKLKGTR